MEKFPQASLTLGGRDVQSLLELGAHFARRDDEEVVRVLNGILAAAALLCESDDIMVESNLQCQTVNTD